MRTRIKASLKTKVNIVVSDGKNTKSVVAVGNQIIRRHITIMLLSRRAEPDACPKPICCRIGNAKSIAFQLVRVIPKITIIFSKDHLQTHAKLTKIIDALNSLRSSFGSENCNE